MSNLQKVKLSDLVSRVKVGFVGSINEYYCSPAVGVPLLRTTDISDLNFDRIKYVTKEFSNKNKKSLVKKGDLIVARHGDNGSAIVYEKDFFAQVLNAVVIEPNHEKMSPYLLKIFLESPFVRKQIKGSVKGSVQGVINTKHLADLLIPLFSDLDYNYIENLIVAIDKKIELNNRINAELEAMAKTLHDYWFVQFDFPDDSPKGQGKPYKTSGGKMVYNPTLKREIPAGWKVDTLSSWIKFDKTGDWGKEEQEGNYTLQVDCIRGADINGLNGNGKIAAPNRFILQKNDHKLLAPFDLVVEISGGSPTQSTGRMAYMTDDVFDRFTHPLICSNFCKAISLRDNDLFYCFAYLWKNLYVGGVLFGWEGKTSGIKNLLFDSFVTKYQVPIPPLGLAKQFFDFVAPLEQKKQTLLKERAELESLRDWLLPMLMNGQVTVGEAS